MDDPRLTPARPEVAAKYLKGKVKAARFVTGEEFCVIDAIAPLRERPAADAMLSTQATTIPYSPSDGVNIPDSGPLQVRNVLIVSDETGVDGNLVAEALRHVAELDHAGPFPSSGTIRRGRSFPIGRTPPGRCPCFHADPTSRRERRRLSPIRHSSANPKPRREWRGLTGGSTGHAHCNTQRRRHRRFRHRLTQERAGLHACLQVMKA